MRWVLGAIGAGLLGWGVILLLPLLFTSVGDTVSLGGWLIGGPILHDAVIAPVIGLLGLAISQRVGRAWRTPVITGLAVSAVLVTLSVPWLWRTFAPYLNPGLHDRNVLLGLVIALGVVWLAVLAAGLLNGRRISAAPPVDG
ncbi:MULTISPECIES: hypothetical protein [unclassified Crossiella]|uniref:hypothetical protein n=1 Tax=unclassified Crossiella TaxID=2620835 RepID=UPI001FFE5A84|nr:MULTISPECIES: hypothetical protein [unclassified Crossiella]MCK2243052.1 hypothetical protein [Crossiella sp. S99.2]MCK2256929.1 hypothetical protein [Crossiella sp. S99.1]